MQRIIKSLKVVEGQIIYLASNPEVSEPLKAKLLPIIDDILHVSNKLLILQTELRTDDESAPWYCKTYNEMIEHGRAWECRRCINNPGNK